MFLVFIGFSSLLAERMEARWIIFDNLFKFANVCNIKFEELVRGFGEWCGYIGKDNISGGVDGVDEAMSALPSCPLAVLRNIFII